MPILRTQKGCGGAHTEYPVKTYYHCLWNEKSDAVEQRPPRYETVLCRKEWGSSKPEPTGSNQQVGGKPTINLNSETTYAKI